MARPIELIRRVVSSCLVHGPALIANSLQVIARWKLRQVFYELIAGGMGIVWLRRAFALPAIRYLSKGAARESRVFCFARFLLAGHLSC